MAATMVSLTCDGCGSAFTKEAHEHNRCLRRDVTHSYCSRQCYRENNKYHGEQHHEWKGGRRIERGNVVVRHNREDRREHSLIAERILGRPMRKGECIWHINGNNADNRHCNLVICTISYRRYLAGRMSYLYQQKHFGNL